MDATIWRRWKGRHERKRPMRLRQLIASLLRRHYRNAAAPGNGCHAEAEETESGASPSRWIEADCYAELANRGWKQQKIAEECGVSQPTVTRFIACAALYSLGNNRPSFWTAYQEVRTDKTTAERLVSHFTP